MEAHGPTDHLEEMLCYLFCKNAPLATDTPLPEIVTPAECTYRRCAIWSLLRVGQQIRACVDMGVLREVAPERRDGEAHNDESLKDYFNINVLSRGGIKWREANGVFLRAEFDGKITEHLTLKVAKQLSEDQWYLGVTGTIDKDTWTMTPPADKSLGVAERRLLPAEKPVYPLPVPQDVHPTFRHELKKLGKLLRPWETWPHENKEHLNKQGISVPDLLNSAVLVPPAATGQAEEGRQGDSEPADDDEYTPNDTSQQHKRAPTASNTTNRSLRSADSRRKRRAEETVDAAPKRQAIGTGIKVEEDSLPIVGGTAAAPFVIDDDDEVDALNNPKLHRVSPPAVNGVPEVPFHGLPLPPNPFQPDSRLAAPWSAAIASRPSPSLTDTSRITPREQQREERIPAIASHRDIRALAISQQKVLERTAELYPDGFEEEFEVSVGKKFKAKIILEKI